MIEQFETAMNITFCRMWHDAPRRDALKQNTRLSVSTISLFRFCTTCAETAFSRRACSPGSLDTTRRACSPAKPVAFRRDTLFFLAACKTSSYFFLAIRTLDMLLHAHL